MLESEISWRVVFFFFNWVIVLQMPFILPFLLSLRFLNISISDREICTLKLEILCLSYVILQLMKQIPYLVGSKEGA